MNNLSTLNQDVAVQNFGKNLILLLFLLLNFFAFISYNSVVQNSVVQKKEVATNQTNVKHTKELFSPKTTLISKFPLSIDFLLN